MAKNEPLLPLSKPTDFPVKPLRRTQSAILPKDTASREGKADIGSLCELGTDSDSDLPDAFSLLKTPVHKAKKTTLSRRRKLVKSASAEVPTSNADDSDAESGIAALKVPGELVLAYGLRKYYPARLLAQPAPNRYTVEFFDGKRSTLSRGRILTMYESKFHTCPLGAIKLVGDEPVLNTKHRIDDIDEQVVDLDKEFERDMRIFHWLVADMEAIRGDLDALHICSLDRVKDIADIEDRMAIFFGENNSAKRLLSSRVSKGFLNRAEFDFLGRLLSKWYTTPPRALVCANTAGSQAKDVAVESPASLEGATAKPSALTEDAIIEPLPAAKDELISTPTSDISQLTEPIDNINLADPVTSSSNTDLAAQTVEFIHEVLLPHAIRRLTMARESCTLAESEIRMAQANEAHWVDQILAARGVSSDSLNEPSG
ncbi:hypothetical protein IWW56_000295 [Coemansia sp. RSA 2131]|nr:hypothetical protein IWW56_000295 [Coemansia sp. RSA 2131]